jgi:CBS domain-containing protein
MKKKRPPSAGTKKNSIHSREGATEAPTVRPGTKLAGIVSRKDSEFLPYKVKTIAVVTTKGKKKLVATRKPVKIPANESVDLDYA